MNINQTQIEVTVLCFRQLSAAKRFILKGFLGHRIIFLKRYKTLDELSSGLEKHGFNAEESIRLMKGLT